MKIKLYIIGLNGISLFQIYLKVNLGSLNATEGSINSACT